MIREKKLQKFLRSAMNSTSPQACELSGGRRRSRQQAKRRHHPAAQRSRWQRKTAIRNRSNSELIRGNSEPIQKNSERSAAKWRSQSELRDATARRAARSADPPLSGEGQPPRRSVNPPDSIRDLARSRVLTSLGTSMPDRRRRDAGERRSALQGVQGPAADWRGTLRDKDDEFDGSTEKASHLIAG
jgi:hypothetical protein